MANEPIHYRAPSELAPHTMPNNSTAIKYAEKMNRIAIQRLQNNVNNINQEIIYKRMYGIDLMLVR